MKRNILSLTLLMAAAFAAAGCYEDKGNYDYTELGDFFVNDDGIKTSYTAAIFSLLEVSPELVYYGNEEEDLEFSWMAYNYSASSLLSEEKDLAVPVPLMPGDYSLEFRAREKATGRITTFIYGLTVESSGSGILVLYKEDGLADCGLITPRILFGDRDQDVVSYNMYTLANPGRPMAGEPVAIGMYKDNNFQHITLLTEDDGVRLSPMDMMVNETFDQWFAFPPSVVKPQAYIAPSGVTGANFEGSDGMEYLINDGTIYANVILFGFGSRTVYGERTMAGGYYAAPFVFQGLGAVVSFDTQNNNLIGGGITATTVSNIGGELASIGKDPVYMGYGFGGSYVVNGIFRDKAPNQSKYHFYVMNLSGNLLPLSADISGYTGISQATAFAFGRRAQLAYYAAGNAVYQIKYSYEGKTVGESAVAAWSGLAAGETVTAMKLCPHPGRNVAADARDKYLFVGAYNESTKEGKVYVLEVNLETDGSVKPQPVATYGGFGRIKDFGFKF